MDFEALRQALSTRPDTQSEQVSVNQRHLIDKILARYSAEFTIYREVIQNANDACAQSLVILFAIDQNNQISSLTIRNDGRSFSVPDWSRLKSIAEGNPDEQKIGFFGVGFYSLFSICEEPMVVSGGECLSFHWKRDQLYTSKGKIEESDSSWTSVYLRLREPHGLPNMDSFAQFMGKSLLFTASLCSISVFINKQEMFNVCKKASPAQLLMTKLTDGSLMKPQAFSVNTVQLTLDKRYESEVASKGFFGDLWRSARESLSGDAELHEAVRRPGKFNLFARTFKGQFKVQLPSKVSSELERVTKKRPAGKVEISAIYSSFDEQRASDTSEKVKHPVLDGVLPSPITRKTHQPTGKIFIGFETHQTTGVAVHFCGPFIPTVERETVDFVDSAVRIWNEAVVGAMGSVLRGVYEEECQQLNALFGKDPLAYTPAADHLIRSFSFSQTAPISVIGRLALSSFLHKQGFMIPTNRGMSLVESCRVVPHSMQPFMTACPQPVQCSVSVPEFDALIESLSAVRKADFEDLIVELKCREFSEEQFALAIQWVISRRQEPPAVHNSSVHQAFELIKVPVGSAEETRSLLTVKYVASNQALIPLNWAVPIDCLSVRYSSKYNQIDWKKLGISELTLSYAIKHQLACNELTADRAEDILVLLSLQSDEHGSDEITDILSFLSSIPCVPSTFGMKRPDQVFLEQVAVFGVSIPVIKLPKKRRLVSDALLKTLGVRSHLPADELLATIESLHWEPKMLISYLSKIQDDLSEADCLRLKNAAVFSASNSERHRISRLYRDSPAARMCKLPILLADTVDFQDELQTKLLRKLDFNFMISAKSLVNGLSEARSHSERMLVYQYFSDNFNYYRDDDYDGLKVVESASGEMLRPSQCFVDPRVALFRMPSVHPDICRLAEQLFRVPLRPCGKLVFLWLKERQFNPKDSFQMFAFCADCDFSDALSLSNVSFIVKSMDSLQEFTTPELSFFKVPTDFKSVFNEIDPRIAPPGSKSANWLRLCGVCEEPGAEELMKAVSGNPGGFLERLGAKKYSSLLKLFSVHYDTMCMATLSLFSKAPTLLGLTDEDADGDSVDRKQQVSLYIAGQVYIGDDAISQRQFEIPCAPQDLESFYERLGCRRVSSAVELSWMYEGAVSAGHPYAKTAEDLVLSRAKLVVKEACRLDEPKQKSALEAIKSLRYFAVPKLLISKSFGGQSKSSATSVCFDKKKNAVYVCGRPDAFDIATCLVAVLHAQGNDSKSSLSDSLLISTLLTMPLDALVNRGFVNGRDDLMDKEEVDNIYKDINIKAPKESSVEQSKRPEVEAYRGENEKLLPPVPDQGPEAHHKNHRPSKDVLQKLKSFIGSAFGGLEKTSNDLPSTLKQGIRATRPNNGHPVQSRGVDKRAPLEGSDDMEWECSVSHDLVRAGHIEKFEYYCPSTAPAKPPPANTLSAIPCLQQLSQIFSLSTSTMHIFHDPQSRTMAFNRGGSLFFNLHYHPHQMDAQRQLVFWYMIACHELAHNFSHAHNMRHEHYMMGYAEHYLGELLQRI